LSLPYTSSSSSSSAVCALAGGQIGFAGRTTVLQKGH
jgi:hypothetical protein